MLNRNKTGLSLIFWTGLDQIRRKLMFRTDFEKHSLDYRRKLKPGLVLHDPTVQNGPPMQNGPGILNRIWTGMGFLFWTVLDQIRAQTRIVGPILKGTMANNHDNPNPDSSLHSYTFDNISRAEWSGHVKSKTKRDWHSYFGLVWTKFDGNSCLGPILKSSV